VASNAGGRPQRAGAALSSPAAAGGSRVRAVDAVRAFAILTVVAGHWLAFALRSEDGRLAGQNLLEIWPPAPWLTWFFQVMPLFFVVGGFGNAASWSSRSATTTALSWVGARTWRLLLPSLALLVAVTVGAVLARGLTSDPAPVALALSVIGLPLWFLAVYLVVVATTPVLVDAESRWGLRVPAVLLGGVVAVDVLSVHVGVPVVGLLTYVLFWPGMYALGICWRSGALARPGLPTAFVVGGSVTLVALVALGPYPVSMVGMVGEEVQNNGPPSAALLALALTQTGLVLLVADRLERWCHRERLWRGVVAVNLVAMSLYLWHMVAAIGAALVFWALGLVAAAEPPSLQWWLQRPLWYVTCALLLAVLVRLVRRVEWRRAVVVERAVTPGRVGLTALGVLLACAGMVQVTVTGLTGGPAGLPVLGLAVFGAGVLAVRAGTGVVGSVAWPSRTRRPRSTARPDAT
jgi:fucose 4-O-acetylase-like acetyltransferase